MPTRPRRETVTSSRWTRTLLPSLSRLRMCRRKIRRPATSSRSRSSRRCASWPLRCAWAPKGKGNFPAPSSVEGRGALMINVMDYISRGVFGLASVVLMLIALALSIYSAGLIVTGLAGPWGEAGHRLLESIGYVVIAIAVFDVARYFVE